jgi:hypothetical protein
VDHVVFEVMLEVIMVFAEAKLVGAPIANSAKRTIAKYSNPP